MDAAARFASLGTLFAGAALSAQTTVGTAGYDAAVHAALARVQTAIEKSVQVAEDHSTWETAWQVSSKHYTVRTTHSHWLGSQIAFGLDSMLEHFTSILRPGFQPGERFVVNLFPDFAAYNVFGNQHGEHHSSIYGSFYAAASPQTAVAAIYDANITRLKMTVTHSAYHQFAARAFPGQTPPTWVDEGLASYFALYWAPEYGIDEHQRLVSSNRFVPLGRLLSASIAGYADNTHDRFMEIGMLFTWMLHYRADTRMPTATEERAANPGRFAGYLRAVLRGDRVDDAEMVKLVNDRPALQKAFRAETFGR